MGITISIVLMLIAAILFLAVQKKWIGTTTLSNLANISAIVALGAAIVVFIIPAAQSPTESPSPTAFLTSLPTNTSTITPSQIPSITSTATLMPTPSNTPTITPSPICGKLKLTDIRPPAVLEGMIRLYKLIGEGFCKDTVIFVSGSAYVGSDPNQPANSAPAEVASDGTWMTVYIRVAFAPDKNDVYILLKNPDGSSAKLTVGYQR